MLALFRNQEGVNFVALLVYLACLKLPFFFIPPESTGLVHYFDLSVNVSVFLAMFCILLQAMWLNILFARLAFYRSRTLIPAAIFISCTSVFPEFNRLNEMHIHMFVFLFVLNQFLAIRTQEPGRVRAFYAGFALGVLGVFLNPSVTMVLFGLFCLVVKQPSSWREYAMYILGILAPFYFFGAAEMYFDRGWNSLLPRNLSWFTPALTGQNLTLLVFSGIYLLAGLAGFVQFLYTLHLLKQKLAFTLMIFCIGIVVCIMIGGDYGLSILYLAVLPMSVFLSLLKLRIPNPLVSDVLHVIFVITVLSLQFIRF